MKKIILLLLLCALMLGQNWYNNDDFFRVRVYALIDSLGVPNGLVAPRIRGVESLEADSVNITKAVIGELIVSDIAIDTLGAYYDTTQVKGLFGEYYDTTQVNDLLASYADTTSLNALRDSLSAYYDSDEVDSILTGYYTQGALDLILTAYATSAALDSALDSLSFSLDFYDEYQVGDTNTGNLLSATGFAIGSGNVINALGHQSIVMGLSNTASQVHNVIIGGYSNIASGAGAVVLGGNNNQSTGENSAVIGGVNSVVQTANSLILGGGSNTITGLSQYNYILGGFSNAITGNSCYTFGSQNTLGGNTSFAFGTGISTSANYVAQFYASASPGNVYIHDYLQVYAPNDTFTSTLRDSSGVTIAAVDTTKTTLLEFGMNPSKYSLDGGSIPPAGDINASSYSVGDSIWLYYWDGLGVSDSFVVYVAESEPLVNAFYLASVTDSIVTPTAIKTEANAEFGGVSIGGGDFITGIRFSNDSLFIDVGDSTWIIVRDGVE